MEDVVIRRRARRLRGDPRLVGVGRGPGRPPRPSRASHTLHAHSPDLFLVAEGDGEVVGTLIAGWDGWRAQMARLAVSPSVRRSGVASRLVEEGERRVRERGAKRIYALVDRRSEAAAPFWVAQGYAANDNIVQFSRNLPEVS